MEDPNGDLQDPVLIALDDTFLYIYTAECLLKIGGMGFVKNPRTYLRDNWNKMDFVIVCTGWIAIFLEGGVNLTALRTLRILRPLRSISSIQGLRIIFLSLVNSFKSLLSTVAVLLFFFLIFAIAGLQLWMGILKYRCINLQTGLIDEEQLCGNAQCPLQMECVKGLDNPNYGNTSFDNILFSFLAVFQSVTLEGWTHIMVQIQKTFSELVVFYFIPLVFIGAFFLLNITLAVVKSSFSNVSNDYKAKRNQVVDDEYVDGDYSFDGQIDKNISLDASSGSEYDDFVQKSATPYDPQDFNEFPAMNTAMHNPAETQDGEMTRRSSMKDIGRNLMKISPIVIEDYRESFSFSSNLVSNHVADSPYLRNQIGLFPNSGESPLLQRNQSSFVQRQPSPINEQQHSNESGTEYLISNTEQRQYSDVEPNGYHRMETLKTEDQSDLQKSLRFITTINRQLTNIAQSELDRTAKSMESPLLPYVTRFRSFRLHKSVLEKLRGQKDLEKIKVVISNSITLEFESKDDVIVDNTNQGIIYDTAVLDFEYIDDFYESIMSPLSTEDSRAQFHEYITLQKRYDGRDAYDIIIKDAHDYIQQILKYDSIHRKIKGHWSGFDVSPLRQDHQHILQQIMKDKFKLWADGIRGIWQKITYPLMILVNSSQFNSVMTLCVVLNTIVLAMDHYGMDSEMEDVLTDMNLSFTIIFIIEMGLKIIGLGLIGYCQDSMNYLDGGVVILSLVELIFLSGSSSALSAFRTIRIFRTFRVMRVARLFRYLSSMAQIMSVVSRSLSDFLYLAMLLMLFILIFALVGMQIFGGQFDFEDGLPRSNFDSFFWAFITVFQVLSMENWQQVLYDGMRGAGSISALYFIFWIFLGNFVLLNLFLAILLDNFSDKEDIDYDNSEDDEDDGTGAHKEHNTQIHTIAAKVVAGIAALKALSNKKRQRKADELADMIGDINHSSQEDSEHLQMLKTRIKEQKPIVLFENIHSEKSFFIFSKRNAMRIWCYRVSNDTRFEYIIQGLILASTIKLVIDTYYLNEPPDSDYGQASTIIDIFFTSAFTLEAFIKSVSMGFVMSHGSYLRESWNQLDFFIVIFSLLEVSVSSLDLSVIKVFRLLRTLRPLRMITHNISMKLVVTALLGSIVAIMNVGIVLIIVWLMFAILGVSLFGGKFYHCQMETIDNMEDCELYGYSWINFDHNFDNVLEAMMTLFIVSSLEGWPDIMYVAVDATDIEQGPKKNNSQLAALYFVVFILIGSFFFLNLFIGVICDKFDEAKTSESSLTSLVLNKEQTFWVEMQRLIVKNRPKIEIDMRPKNYMRGKLYDIAKSGYFDGFIMICIVLNMLQMAIIYDEATPTYVFVLDVINLVFTGVFLVECIIKMTGLGVKPYFNNKWNRFDFFVVLASIIDITMSYFMGSAIKILRVGPQLARVIRVLRVSRLFRIVKSLKKIQDIVNILTYSLPAIMNVLALLLLIYFIYAILGVFLFNQVENGEVIDEYMNFSNFHKSMVLLFRVSTGEEWNVILYDCKRQAGYITAALFFVSFITITSFIMLNMFIMVILQNYDQYENEPENVFKVFNHNIKRFRKAWNQYTTSIDGERMHYKDIVDFMYLLGPELGVPAKYERGQVIKLLFIMGLNIDDNGFVYYNDILFSILKRAFANKLKKTNKPVENRLLHNEEAHTQHKLDEIRAKMQSNYYLQPRVRFIQKTFQSKQSNNFFFTMMSQRMVFRAWKNWVARRIDNKEDSWSITPPDSAVEYPGEVSMHSSVLSSNEHGY